MRKLLIASCLLVALVSACGNESKPDDNPEATSQAGDNAGVSSPAGGSAQPFVDLARGTLQYEFEPFETPAALLDDSLLGVLGEVRTVEDGRLQGPLDQAPAHHIVVGLAVTESFKSDPGQHGDLVYFELRRPDNVSADTYAKALPKGTRIVLMAYAGDKPVYEPTTDNYAGREEGSSLYSPAPQGLLVEVDGRLQNVMGEVEQASWGEVDTVEEMREALSAEAK
jgi:hypothetical protein